MISCNRGIVNVEGSDVEIECELTVLIHALEREYAKKLGKKEAHTRIKRCYDLAMTEENRNFLSDEEIGEKSVELMELVKKFQKVLDDICGESEDDK